jgi:hypothetical protein
MSLSSAIRKLFSSTSPETDQQNRLKILSVDHTSISPIPVPTKDQSLSLTLEIPYERYDMRIPQVKKEVMKMYSKLAEFIDEQLRHSGTSLPQLHNQLTRAGGYYDNILYTIYCISEGEVTTFYKPSNGYDNSYSYGLLKERVGEKIYEDFQKFSKDYTATLPQADEETCEAYHLTPNGLERLWWDTDGSIRQKSNINEYQIKLLNRTPGRSTQVLRINEVRAYVLAQYLSTLSVLRKELTETQGWSKKMSTSLERFFNQNNHYWYGADDVRLLGYILKICEQTVRKNIPYSRLLKTEEEIAHLRRVLPKSVSELVLEKATQPSQAINLSAKAVELLRKQNPHSWRQDIRDLKDADINKSLKILNQYKSDTIFNRIAKEAIKHISDKNIQLIVLYSYYSTLPDGKGDWATKQKLHSLITHKDQQKEFDKLTSQTLPLDLGLLKRLQALTVAPVRTVKLNSDRLSVAYGEHEEALKKVSSYLGEDKTKENSPNPKTKEKLISVEDLFESNQDDTELNFSFDQRKFLKLIVKNNWSLAASIAEEFAKSEGKLLRAYIQELNQRAYKYIEDQLIVQDNDRIIVDEMYKDLVNRTLNAGD